MRYRSLAIVVLSIVLCCLSGVTIAQCNAADQQKVAVASIATTPVTCPQNGTITVDAVTGGGGEYSYEIVYGPVLRGIQSQGVFSALSPGRYMIRVSGCNGTFYDSDTIVVPNNYLEPGMQTLTFVSKESFKCNTSNTGKVRVSINLSMPSGSYNDTNLYRLPLRYQVSTNGDPATGFDASPFQSFSRSYTVASTSGGITTRSYMSIDTIKNLNAATTYYVRVTDGCGVFKTVSITMPSVSAPVMSYAFDVKEPFIINPASTDYPNVKGNCIQWGELTILANGTPVNSLASSNSYLPITTVLKRQDNGAVLDTRTYESGSLIRQSNFGIYYGNNRNNRIFDSVPRIPLVMEITDACGTLTTINVNAPSVKVPFKLQAFVHCGSGSPYTYINTINAAPSSPIRYKLYNQTNTLLLDTMVNNNYQYVSLASSSFNLGQTFVPSLGIYRTVFTDQCGITDSIEFNFNGGAGVGAAPILTFTPYHSNCARGDGIARYTVDAVQSNVAPFSSMQIVSGPAALSYPRSRKFINIPTGSYFSTTQVMCFDSLIAGTYQVQIKYGCNQVLNTSFTIGAVPVSSYTAALAFTVMPNDCNSSGTEVEGTATVTGASNTLVNDMPYVRFTAAPAEFLKMISRSKDGSNATLPFNLGFLSAYATNFNGLDTSAVQVLPLYTYSNIMTSGFVFPDGTYRVEIFGKCTGTVYAQQSFTITGAGYSRANLGASSGYVCTGGGVKVVANPIGGKRPFLYQIKLASDPDDSHYSVLQADSTFTLPAATAPGTVFSLRVVDACNNSFTGQVAINNFTGTLYIVSTNDCIGLPSRIITGYVTGGTYTWTKPDGTVIVTNSNQLNISEFAISDIGTYYVSVDALSGCISQGTAKVIGNLCYSVLPVTVRSFTAEKEGSQAARLQWQVEAAGNLHHFEIERSEDGNVFSKIGDMAYTPQNDQAYRYTFVDRNAAATKAPLVYYRIKLLSLNGKAKYTEIRKLYLSSQFQITKVYPTPFVSAFNIDFVTDNTAAALIQLHDMGGREVSRSIMPVTKGVNHYQYTPVLSINAGTYLLTMKQGENVFTTRIVKVN